MKIVFIAGKYFDTDDLVIEEHILIAKRIAALCAAQHIGYFCPHLNSAHFQMYLRADPGEGFFKQMDISILSKCDALLLIPNWSISIGAVEEYDWWRANREESLIFACHTYREIPQALVEWYHSGVVQK
jgi:hypothetical protein